MRNSLKKRIYERFVWLVWVATYVLFKPIAALYHRREEVPEKLSDPDKVPRPAIIISNHKSVLDPWLVLTSLPFKTYCRLLPIRIMGSVKFSNHSSRILQRLGLVRIVYFLYNVLPIDNSRPFEEKIASSIDALKHDETLLIFPEGKVCPKETAVRAFKRGVVAIELATHAPIIPAAVRFVEEGNRRECVVRFGKDVQPYKRIESYASPDDRFKKGGEYLRRKVRNLFGPAQHRPKRA